LAWIEKAEFDSMNAVDIKNLTKRFGPVAAIDGVDLEVKKGEIVGLIGPDGAGKTTLLRLLMGLLKPDSGTVRIEGFDSVKNPLEVKKRAGYMPQHFSLYGDLRVSENLKFYADLYRVPLDDFRMRKKELLRFSGLAPFEKRLARNLSGGMQKKLALSCNLFHTPEILFLDEPTTGVDPVSRSELWDLLFQLNKKGVTLIVTTPYMDEAQMCHRIGFIFEGKVLSYLSPEELIADMEDDIIEVVSSQPEARKRLKELPDLLSIYPYGGTFHLTFEAGKGNPIKIKEFSAEKKISVQSLKKIPPSFEDVFLALIKRQTVKEENNYFEENGEY
jgi:ABC-2 type transport system ATP-binding protein